MTPAPEKSTHSPQRRSDVGRTQSERVEVDVEPLFVLCVPRSGSTLLGRVLDVHSQLACPPEIELVRTFEEIRHTFEEAWPQDPPAAHSQAATLCRELADRTYGAYARENGKRRWVSKTLNAALSPDILLDYFPQARFLCLYRSCADTVASLFDASNTGYDRYGLESFVVKDIHNIYQALAAYWLDRSERIEAFESMHRERCHRVRYEEMVVDPHGTFIALFAFLGIAFESECLSPSVVFASNRRFPGGGGDYKIAYTNDFVTSSIGRGSTVPIHRISPDLRRQIDLMNGRLGYPSLGEFPNSAQQHGQSCQRRLAEIFGEQLPESLKAARQGKGPSPIEEAKIAIVLPDLKERWLIDTVSATVRQTDHQADFTVVTDSESFIRFVDGSYNIGTAIKDGRILVGTSHSPANAPIPADILLPYIDLIMSLVSPVPSATHSALRP
jgi:protein-tyrosine sulfotransferase